MFNLLRMPCGISDVEFPGDTTFHKAVDDIIFKPKDTKAMDSKFLKKKQDQPEKQNQIGKNKPTTLIEDGGVSAMGFAQDSDLQPDGREIKDN